MAKQPTNTSRFQSTRGGGYITVAQWLAEFICLRQASATNKDLPNHFWKLPDWEKPFLRQLRAANSLLRAYSSAAISRALRSKDGQRVLSLAAPWLDDMVAREQRALEAQQAATVVVTPTQSNTIVTNEATIATPRRPFKSGKSTLDKLNE